MAFFFAYFVSALPAVVLGAIVIIHMRGTGFRRLDDEIGCVRCFTQKNQVKRALSFSGTGLLVTLWLFKLGYKQDVAYPLVLLGLFWHGTGALTLGS